MSWENLDGEIAELFAEYAPICIFDLDRYAPQGAGCEWPCCKAAKMPGHGEKHCVEHSSVAAEIQLQKKRARAARIAKLMVSRNRRCQRCVRFTAVAGFDLCVTCARQELRRARRERAA